MVKLYSEIFLNRIQQALELSIKQRQEMAPVFSSLNLSIIFGNGKMLRGRSSGACLTGRPEPPSRACAGELTLWTSGDLKVLHADNAKHQTGEAKQILQWRKEEQELATVLMRSAQS